MTFRDGWNNFIEGNSYMAGDKLEFSYVGNTTFKIYSTRGGRSLDDGQVGEIPTTITTRGPRPRWLTNEEYSYHFVKHQYHFVLL